MKFNLIVEVDEKRLFSLYQKLGIPVKNIEECVINEIGVNERDFGMKVVAIHTIVEDKQ
jgi:hypothetical protein